jgi:predicted transcriptional regulator
MVIGCTDHIKTVWTNSIVYQMFSEFNTAGYQQPLIVRQSSPPVLPVRTLTPVLPVRVSSIQRSSPTTQTWQQSEIKYAPSIESTTFGSSNSLPPIVLPTYPRSQEQFVDQTVPPVMTQSLGAIPVGSVPLSPQSYNRTQVFSSAKIVPYLQVRAPQPQYDDYLIDQGPTSKVPEFKIQSPTALTLDKLINLQVIYVDSSEQENAIKKVFESQYIFLDGRFPPDYYQLFGNMDRRDPAFKQRAQVLAWRRFSEVYPNSDIFGAGISPFNIFQGGFGTCYFLVGLSTLAERPQRIRDLFIWDTINDHKVYVCTLLFRGRWKTIYVDEYFPLPRNEYSARGARGCSIGAKGQMWVSLLEKAWAKLYGSYFRVEGGYTEEGLHDLTGAHMRFVHTRSIEFVKE